MFGSEVSSTFLFYFFFVCVFVFVCVGGKLVADLLRRVKQMKGLALRFTRIIMKTSSSLLRVKRSFIFFHHMKVSD